MPPKKVKVARSDERAAPTEDQASTSPAKSKSRSNGTGTKRKAARPSSSAEPQQKAARRSRRGDRHSASASPDDTIAFLLSAPAREQCIHADELEAAETKQRVYSTPATLSVFEELLSALILSRPISHALGQRAIRTLLNPPFSLTTPGAVQAAGQDRVHDALTQARTQHKAKTATQIAGLADVVMERFATGPKDGSLAKLTGDYDEVCLFPFFSSSPHILSSSLRQVRPTLQSSIKGLGATGLDIFTRRTQASFPPSIATHPFLDAVSVKALDSLHLPSNPADLVNLVKKKAGKEHGEKETFVMLLERATGALLEGNVDDVLAAVANSQGHQSTAAE